MPRLSEHAETHLAEYRPVCSWAIAGLLLAVASLVVLVADHPGFWALPAAAVAASLAGLWRTGGICVGACARRPSARTAAAGTEPATDPPHESPAEPPMQGRALAAVGLLLSLTLLAAGPAHRMTRFWWARQESAQFADAWLEMLRQHRHREAHELTLAAPRRCPTGEPLSHCYRDDLGRQESLDRFVENATIARLLTWGQSASIERAGTRRQWLGPNEDLVGHDYRVRVRPPADGGQDGRQDGRQDGGQDGGPDGGPADGGRAMEQDIDQYEEYELRILLKRTYDRNAAAAWWQVEGYRLVRP